MCIAPENGPYKFEALSFAHYVEYGGLVSYEQAQANLCGDSGQPVGRTYMPSFAPALMRKLPWLHPQLFPLPLSDYVLGICDLTGELMRLAISSISKPNGR